jgi:DNA-3-methyladenine glycosylase
LLGAQVSHAGVTVTLVEVEAYAGEQDPASHAARGPTPRNAPMFGPPGRWYVYFVYGMHWCANVTTGPPGSPSAVLLRGGRVTAGLTTARSRRPGRPDALLARGPAALAAVLALTGADTGSTVALRSATRRGGSGYRASRACRPIGVRRPDPGREDPSCDTDRHPHPR